MPANVLQDVHVPVPFENAAIVNINLELPMVTYTVYSQRGMCGVPGQEFDLFVELAPNVLGQLLIVFLECLGKDYFYLVTHSTTPGLCLPL